jgi:cyanate permease
MFGMVGGPLLAGVLADVTGSYSAGFTVLALLSGAGMLFFALASPPKAPDDARVAVDAGSES